MEQEGPKGASEDVGSTQVDTSSVHPAWGLVQGQGREGEALRPKGPKGPKGSPEEAQSSSTQVDSVCPAPGLAAKCGPYLIGLYALSVCSLLCLALCLHVSSSMFTYVFCSMHLHLCIFLFCMFLDVCSFVNAPFCMLLCLLHHSECHNST